MSESSDADPGEETAAPTETIETEGQTTEGQEAEGKAPEGEVITEKYKSAIDKQHEKFRNEERDHVGTKQLLADATAKLAEFQAPDTTLIQVPELPDQYDEDYAEKMNQRDQILTHNATVNARAQSAEETQAANKRTTERAVLVDLQTKGNAYTKKAIEYGISPEEMSAAAGVIQSYDIPAPITVGLLTDPDGPVIIKHLAANPLELSAIKDMDPFTAANYINTNIRPQAQLLKPKGTSAGAPPDELPGSGGADPDANKNPNSKGATFD